MNFCGHFVLFVEKPPPPLCLHIFARMPYTTYHNTELKSDPIFASLEGDYLLGDGKISQCPSTHLAPPFLIARQKKEFESFKFYVYFVSSV